MTCPSIVRVARPEDRQEVWRLFLQGHRENGLFAIEPEKVDWFITRALCPEAIPAWDSGIRGTIGVVGPVGALEALAFLVLGEYWYTSKKHIEEFIVYVDPECRKSRHVSALHDWMELQVDRTNLPMVTGIMSNTRTEAKCRLYQRRFIKIGEFFFCGPKGSMPFATAMSS